MKNPVNAKNEKSFKYSIGRLTTCSADKHPQFTVCLSEGATNTGGQHGVKSHQIKITYLDHTERKIKSFGAPNFSESHFERIGFQSLEHFARFLKASDGRHALLAGDMSTAKASLQARRINETDEDGPRFVDTPTRLFTLDCDRVSPSLADPAKWWDDSDFDILDRDHWEHLGRTLIDVIAPGKADAQFIISPTGSADREKLKFRLYTLTDQALTIKQRRALNGPALDPLKVRNHDAFGCDLAITNAVNNLIYVGQKVFVTDQGQESALRAYLDQQAERFGANTLGLHRALYHGWNGLPEGVRPHDPFASVRNLYFPGRESIAITESLLDPSRIPVAPRKVNRRADPSTPMTAEDRARLDVVALKDIGGEAGTHDAMREFIFSQKRIASLTGNAFDADLIERGLRDRLSQLQAEQRAAGRNDRARTLEAYARRELPRMIAAAKEAFDRQASEAAGAGEGYFTLDEDEDEDAPRRIGQPEKLPETSAWMSLSEGEAKLSARIRTAVEETDIRAAHLIAGTVGLGKSRAMRHALIDRLDADDSLLVAIWCPTHGLAREWSEALNAQRPGVSTVYKGKDHQPSPDEAKLCAVSNGDNSLWRKAHGNSLTACKTCRFRVEHPSGGPCQYFAQKSGFERARIHIYTGPGVLFGSVPELARRTKKGAGIHVAGSAEDDDSAMEEAFLDHAEVHNARASAIAGQYGLIVIDETQAASWLVKDDLAHGRFGSEIEANEWITADKEGLLPLDVALKVANDFRLILAERLEAGLIFRGPESIGLDKNRLMDISRALARLKIHGGRDDAKGLFGSVEAIQRREARDILKAKGTYCELVYALAEIAQTMLEHGSMTIDRIGEKPLVRWSRKAAFHKHWNAPKVVLDASADADLLRLWWPDLNVTRIEVREPKAVRRYFLAGDAVTHGASKQKRAETLKQVQGALDTLKAGYDARHQRAPLVGVISLKELVLEAGEGEGGLSASMNRQGEHMAGHFGALRGLNRFRDADRLLIAGRALPPRNEIERTAGDLKGGTVEGAAPGDAFPKRMRPMLIRRGDDLVTGHAETWTHPDPVARAILDSVVAAELRQADGRARAIRRGHEVDGWQADHCEIWHATGGAVPGLPYDDILPDGEGMTWTLADLDANTPEGKVFGAYLQGKFALDRAGWADIAGLTESQYHKLKDNNRHLLAVEAAAEARRKNDMVFAAMIEAEDIGRGERSYMAIAESFAAEGIDLKAKATKTRAKAEIEASGREFKDGSWRQAIKRVIEGA